MADDTRISRTKAGRELLDKIDEGAAKLARARNKAKAVLEDASTMSAIGPVAGAALAGALDARGMTIGPVNASTAAGIAALAYGIQAKKPAIASLGGGLLTGVAYRLGYSLLGPST